MSAAEIVYDFETPGSISGTTSEIVYTVPDTNTFGVGVSVGSVELSDNSTPASDYGRIEELGGGSVEAAVNDRDGNSISFTVTIDETVTVDLTSLAFDTSFYFFNTGDSSVGWDFSTTVGANPATNVTSSTGWTHDGGANYQSPGGSASGAINLTGLTGLTDTTVTFTWTLDSSRNNTFERAALGLDDIVLTGEVVSDLPTSSIDFTFEDSEKISGAGSEIVYAAPDINTFGSGVTVGSLELSDGDDAATHYGRIESLGEGSVEAALTDRAGPGTISFDVTIDETVTVDLTNITFDTAFRFTSTGDSTVDWSFSTSVGGIVNNETIGSFVHGGTSNYQSPESASGDVALTGLAGLTDTTVTFTWTLDSTRSNTFAVAALGLDDIVLTGAVVADDGRPRIRLFQADETDVPINTPVLLSWAVDRADSVSLSGIGTVNATDSATVVPSEDSTYTLTASNEIGTVQAEVMLTTYVPPPVIHDFSATTHLIETGGTEVTLAWNVSGADTVSIAPDLGSVSNVGQTSFVVDEATTYTLTASNASATASADWIFRIAQSTPNILLMLVDDWGVTDLSVPFAYTSYDDDGTPIITNLNNLHKTPNLETLASMGMKFTQAYATPKCSSTRATLMTGYHPARHGITFHLAANSTIGNGPNNWRFNGFDSTDVTLAHLLKPANYRTIHVGKWHLGGPGDYAQYPTAVGFDINIGGSNAGSPGYYVATAGTGFARSGKPMPNLDQYIGTGMYLTKALTTELNKAMDDSVEDGVPFFGYMSYYGVHDPETTNPDAVGDYSDAINADHLKFCTMVEAIDVSFGDIIDHLEELGIAEETLIIHMGDNGSENPVHRNNQGSIPIAPFDDFPMRGMKNDGYQGGSRVPLMVSWAKPNPNAPLQRDLTITGGSVEHDIVGIEDIAPTILALAGVEPPFMDGYDLRPYFRGEAGSHRPQSYLLYYPNGSFPNGQLNWYREGDWKLMYGYEADQFLLFNLADDPTESNDLASSEPERVVQMARTMARELDSKWGDLGKLWPVVAGTYPPRPGTDDPFFLPYDVGGRDLIDTDGDGLVDAFEDLDSNGLVNVGETDSDNADTDGDHTDDYTEIRLNLDPLDANAFFAAQLSTANTDILSLTWPSAPGLFFNVLASEDLSTPVADWEVIESNVSAHETLNETTQDLPVDLQQQFFSVELLP